MTYASLTDYTRADVEKQKIMARLLLESSRIHERKMEMSIKADRVCDSIQPEPENYLEDSCDESYVLSKPVLNEISLPAKFCPKCGRKYGDDENFCLECAVKLRAIKDVDISEMELNPHFEFRGENCFHEFDEILTGGNLEKIAVENFDVEDIAAKIRKIAFRRLDTAIKDSGIYLDSLSVADKILLFAKAFVDVENKSYGPELGYYKFNRIYIDDRQSDALKITTTLHELTHFLIKEIMTHVLCSIWNCTKTHKIESVAAFILSYSPITGLVDEYAAHTVEGRFTLYGFQDYSSFLSLEKTIDLDKTEIEMLKTIGNTFANIIKDILESFIDADMLDEIKGQFTKDILDRPDYTNLVYENCKLLNDEGLIEAVRLLLSEGFAVAMDNAEKLESYDEMW
ncbi:hypothetical protein [Methanobrevibacter sp.]